jgi:hypothetical protein
MSVSAPRSEALRRLEPADLGARVLDLGPELVDLRLEPLRHLLRAGHLGLQRRVGERGDEGVGDLRRQDRIGRLVGDHEDVRAFVEANLERAHQLGGDPVAGVDPAEGVGGAVLRHQRRVVGQPEPPHHVDAHALALSERDHVALQEAQAGHVGGLAGHRLGLRRVDGGGRLRVVARRHHVKQRACGGEGRDENQHDDPGAPQQDDQ